MTTATMSDLDIEAFHQADRARRERAVLRAATGPVVEAPVQPPVTAPKLRKSAPLDPLEGCSHGTRVLYAWADWLRANKLELAESITIFTKDAVRLAVHVYRRPDGTKTCGCVKFDDSLPKTIIRFGTLVKKGESRIREFREWKESLETITAKLTARGWVQKLQK